MPGQANVSPSFKINGSVLKNAESFSYVGSFLSVKADINDEIQHRLRAASYAFGRMRERVFEERGIITDTNVKIYKAVVLPSLLYDPEFWTTYLPHLKTLEKYHQRCILGISWTDRQTNTSVLEEANSTSIDAMVAQSQRWSGHVGRMDKARLPRQILYDELSMVEDRWEDRGSASKTDR